MICFTHDRLTARRWFESRKLLQWGISIAVFAFLFFVLQFFSVMLAFGIALIIAFCLFFFVLDNTVIAIRCPHCKRLIKTNTPWVCGYKGCRNENADDFPFISECEHCQAEPKAYKCHHTDCAKLIFLGEDQQTFNFAQCINMPPPKSETKRVRRDKHTDEMTDLRKSIERKELQAKAGELDVKLKEINKSLQDPKMKNLMEMYRARLKNEDDAKRLHASIDAEFANDPVEREKRHSMVKELMLELPI